MLWYVLQTRTGEEEKLVGLIHRIVPKDLYEECFVVYQEQLWRRQQQNFVHVKRAFPGYVFITSREPKALFFCLKQVPAMSKMMADDDFVFLSVERDESEFLEKLMNEDHVIRLSYMSTDGEGTILHVSGPLEVCVPQIMQCRFGKRYVLVKLKLLGEEKTVLLGIVLDEDIRQELRYGKVEAPIQVPKRYRPVEVPEKEKIAEGKLQREKEDRQPALFAGDRIEVTGGVFAGMSGIVYRVKNNTAKVGIHLFGQDMEIEIPVDIVRKISLEKDNF